MIRRPAKLQGISRISGSRCPFEVQLFEAYCRHLHHCLRCATGEGIIATLALQGMARALVCKGGSGDMCPQASCVALIPNRSVSSGCLAQVPLPRLAKSQFCFMKKSACACKVLIYHLVKLVKSQCAQGTGAVLRFRQQNYSKKVNVRM